MIREFVGAELVPREKHFPLARRGNHRRAPAGHVFVAGDVPLELEGRLRFDRTTYLSQTRKVGSGRSASGFGRVRHDLIAAFVW